MVLIDMPTPLYCEECPCSYWIQSGGHEGELMCEAIESKLSYSGAEEILEKSLVDPMDRYRPAKCPIVCEIAGGIQIYDEDKEEGKKK